MRRSALLPVILAFISPTPLAFAKEPVDWVDPMLGTANSRWMLVPGPSMPFGMVNLSPDTQEQVWNGGHDYHSTSIMGFSHIHSWVMAGLLTMPTNGPLKVLPGTEEQPDTGYRSRYSHDTEVARAGYYAVTLDDYGIRAELTATQRTGFQRYTFPESTSSRILFDLKFPDEYGFRLYDGKVTQVSDTEIEGYSTQLGRGINSRLENDYKVHFVARFSKPIERFGGWNGGENIQHDVKTVLSDGDLGAFVEFSTGKDEVVMLKTGISLVSIEQARLNLDTEQKEFGWDFDACREAGRQTWNKLLKTIEVQTDNPADMTKFYTNLYRSYSQRADLSDVNGKYVDMYEKVQQMEDPTNGIYGCDAFWNTFWNLNQLWNLATPDISRKWVISLLEIYDRGGWLPKGPTGIEYSGVMVASHQIAFLVAAYQHGIRGYDVEKVYEAIRKPQMVPGRMHEGGGFVGNRQLEPYMEHGYIPVEAGWRNSEAAPASNTLEYAYDDWCVAQMAKVLGKEEDYRYFLARAHNYRNVLDPETKYARPRHLDGTWLEPFDPFQNEMWYIEGNAWQYTWFAPHDVRGLVDFLGQKTFVDRLEEGFRKAKPDSYASHRYVNHGNQPNMQAAWLFNHAGEPWKTQQYTTELLNNYYGTGPDGYPGEEDQGQMGAWFVMASMGLFQMEGGCLPKPVYEVSTPLFDKVVIHLDPKYYNGGGTFTIETRNRSDRNIYIQSATLNGKPLEKAWFYQSEIISGGTLVFDLGPEPNRSWGAGLENAPPSMTRTTAE